MDLIEAILYGDTHDVAAAISQTPQVNEIDPFGFTPLIEAAIMNNVDVGRLLIDAGADVNMKDTTGGYAIHWTVDNSNYEFTELLLKHGADANSFNRHSQPILIKPILRRQHQLKRLLYDYGANQQFAQDYINAKLTGHRFQLLGVVDIVSPAGTFLEITFEGFFLEFTLGLIRHSLMRYRRNFGAKRMKTHFTALKHIVNALTIASKLIRFQQYAIDRDRHDNTINDLLDQELLLIPVAYEGHAITFTQFGNYIAKCDRGEASRRGDSVTIFEMKNPHALSNDLIKKLIYRKSDKIFILEELPLILGLEAVTELPLPSQITGNCSWANVEAVVPTILLLLSLRENPQQSQAELAKSKKAALQFYHAWQEWDKNTALNEVIHRFSESSPARKASKAAILAAVFFQACDHSVETDLQRAKMIWPVLQEPGYGYLLETFKTVYIKRRKTAAGENLWRLISFCE